ncbi:MAG: triphosphoribosyl-dephospho-CoA synthase [Firmicutes bacterium]|nr:triphosphoribosyl-dephospho-CoA synthase [Bacillota bacterium]
MHWGDIVTTSLLVEVSADKIGNVRPTHRFSDVGPEHFIASAFAVGAAFERGTAEGLAFGDTVLSAMEASLAATQGRNVHLGSILALAPLVYGYGPGRPWAQGVRAVIEGLTLADTDAVFRAIRATRPRWLAPGETVADDVYREPTRPLLAVFASAAGYDWIAREYVRGFATVLDHWAPSLARQLERSGDWSEAARRTFYAMLLSEPDSFWIRKNGWEAAAAQHARVKRAIIAEDWTTLSRLLDDADNRWNPGTFADLVAASVLVAWVRRWSA